MYTNKSGIYTITSPSGKCYVGSAVNFNKRWYTHLSDFRRGVHTKLLQEAYNQYGESGLIFKTIVECPKDALLIYEQWAMMEFCPEYNSAPKAGSTLGVTHTKEALEKMSKAHKGVRLSDDHKKKIGAFFSGRQLEEEHKNKIGLANAGEKNGFFGKKHTPESKQKISERHTGSNHSRARSVQCIETGDIFDTVTLAENWLRSNTNYKKAANVAICRVCSGKRNIAYGYTWKYYDK